MNDINKTINHMRQLQKRYTTQHNGKICERVQDAIEALEKQIPKKPYDKVIVQPVIDQNGAYVDADVHITFHCPVCGKYVGCELEESHYNYCFECGQRIGWDNDNSGGDADGQN